MGPSKQSASRGEGLGSADSGVARLILFPGARRIGLARKFAKVAARHDAAGCETSIANALRRQAQAFARIGADPDEIAVHVQELRSAIDTLLLTGRRRVR